MRMLKRIITGTIIGLMALAVMVVPVMAAYSISLQLVENGTGSTTMFAAQAPVDIDFMATNNYISATGLDTRVSLDATSYPHMLADDRVLWAQAVDQGATYNITFTTDNTALPAFDIITGFGGYITTADALALELGNDFELEWDGYINTDADANKYLVQKLNAFEVYISGATDITARIARLNAIAVADITPGVAGSWQTVDVTANVGDDAVAVYLRLVNASDRLTFVRPIGFAGDWDFSAFDTRHTGVVIGIDASNEFQVYIENLADCKVYLIGQVTADFTQLTTPILMPLNVAGSAQTLDITGDTSATTSAAVFWIENTDVANHSGLIRHRDVAVPTGNVQIEVGMGYYLVATCDDQQRFDYYITDTDVDAYLIGYFENTGFTNYSGDAANTHNIAVANVWEDWDMSAVIPSGDTVVVVEFRPTGAGEYDFGAREDGSADTDWLEIGIYTASGILVNLPTDDSRIIEVRASNTNGRFFYMGSYGPDEMDNQYFDWPVSVTASGVANGEHIVTVYADGIDLDIDIDSVNEDTDALGGVSVINNDSDYVWTQTNVNPYLDYITLDISSVEIVRYEPAAFIVGTTLLDETGAAQNGVITWGANPGSVTTTLGILIPTAVDQVGVELDPPDIAGDIVDPADMFPTDVSMGNPGTIFDQIFIDLAAIASNTPIQLVWWFFYGMASVLTVAIVYKGTHHLALAGFAQVVIGGMFVAAGIVPFWFIIMNVVAALGLLTAERMPSV